MLIRVPENPLLEPNLDDGWQSYAAFNPCPLEQDGRHFLLYRAQSAPRRHEGEMMSLSTIGLAGGETPFRFNCTRQFIVPSEPWDRFGCEDPRATRIDDTWFIFYTALSRFPFDADGIRVGVALSRDLHTIDAKRPVTPFNAKAMALFPERINGRLLAVLTVDTDHPPAKIALAWFDRVEDIWSEEYWRDWIANLPAHVIPLMRSAHDHVEVGAAPVRTDKGWLLVHSYIRNYHSDARHFAIEAVLLDPDDPSRIVGRTADPLLVPEHPDEMHGDVPNVVFPSGARIEDGVLYVYYGAADTKSCVATIGLDELLAGMCRRPAERFIESRHLPNSFHRFSGNPVLAPRPELHWEARSVFNPAAIHLDGHFHLLYRAMSPDDTSVFGYACSRDGLHFDVRGRHPAYVPREAFELKSHPGNSGCEDPRLTLLENRLYVLYTAYDGNLPRVAMSAIDVDDFLVQRWRWDKPQVISAAGVDDKDACLFPERIGGRCAIFHRVDGNMYLAYVDRPGDPVTAPGQLVRPEKQLAGLQKFGISAPPIRTGRGWLLFFHYVAEPRSTYRVEALLLDAEDPARIVAESAGTLLEPEADYERSGDVPDVVFPCGAVLHEGVVHLFYGGGDRVVGVARMLLEDLWKQLGV